MFKVFQGMANQGDHMLKQLINLVFPIKCIFCGELLGFDNKVSICNECYGKIPFFDDRVYELGPLYSFDNCICLCEYSGIIKDAIKRYKFYNKPAYYRTFGKLLADKIMRVTTADKIDIIISIPLNKDRQNQRGYNQSYLISNYISKLLKISEKSYALGKVRNTGVQSLMNRNLRAANVEGAYKVLYPEKVKGRRVFLIDDILTTGSTLSECSRVLKESGAVEVTAVAIASGRKFI